jgi:hypothetical protein
VRQLAAQEFERIGLDQYLAVEVVDAVALTSRIALDAVVLDNVQGCP